MSNTSAFTPVVRLLADVFEPLRLALQTPEDFAGFMESLGWNVLGHIGAVQALGPLLEAVQEIAQRDPLTDEEIVEVLARSGTLFSTVKSLSTATGLPSSVNAAQFKQEFPTQLRDFLIVEYLFYQQPKLGRLLETSGVVQQIPVAEGAGRPEFLRRQVAWDKLGDLLSNPLQAASTHYAWGEDTFAWPLLLSNLVDLGRAFGFSAGAEVLAASEIGYLHQGATDPTASRHLVRWHLYRSRVPLQSSQAGLIAAFLPKTSSAQPGVAILPYFNGEVGQSFQIAEGIRATVTGQLDSTGGVVLKLRPGRDPELVAGFREGAGTAAFELILAFEHGTTAPTVLLGDPTGTRLQYDRVTVRCGSRALVGQSSGVSGFAELDVAGARLIVSTGSADGFLAKLLGNGFEVEFSGTLGLNSEHGLYFTGSAGLELEIPAHISFGAIEIHGVRIGILPSDGEIPIELSSTISANFGVISALVENLGIRALLTTPAGGGKLGPFDFEIEPKPPDGVAVGIEAGVVRGLGYFYFDKDKGEYGGALELTIAEMFSVKAFGLVNTRMPNGKKTFSMVVIMTFEFPDPGIQLGMGFRLLGVGGILGIERAIDLDELVARMRSGALLRLVYPPSLEANVLVPLFDDLRAIFPIGKSTLIGPFLKLAYGTPTLVDIKIGVIFEIPGNIVILGVVSAILPKEQGAVLRLTVSFVGVYEPNKGRIWFFATLVDSRLVSYALDGELGVLAQFKGSRKILLLAGGAHPRYDPPPLPFPMPSRLSLEILNHDNAKIRAEAYFGVWSGGTMFGVRAELYFGYSAFEIDGHIAFDCLIRWDPFSFNISLSASLSAKVFGVGCFSIHLGVEFEGPRPYRIQGEVKIAIRCAPDIHKSIDKEWGSSRGQALPSIEAFPIVAAEIDRIENWGTELPPGARLLVTLRDRPQGDSAILIHPTGRLRIIQRSIPLDLTIDKVGNQKPSDVKRFSLTASGTSLTKVGDAMEQFSGGQYLSSGEASTLSRADFEPMVGGILVSASGEEYATGPVVRRRVRYEEIIIDTNYKRASRKFVASYNGKLFRHWLRNGSVGRSVLSRLQEQRLNGNGERQVTLTGDRYTVARQADNKAFASDVEFASEAAARDYIRRHEAADPNIRGTLHVISSYEVAA